MVDIILVAKSPSGSGSRNVSGLEKVLTIALVFLTFLCVHFYWRRTKAEIETEDAQPLDTFLVCWFALVFVFFIFCSFVYFSENKIQVGENIGQVGDFIGGLTNPVLSFLALLVLLRTTSIQTGEARKTSRFMEMQQLMLEREKFENTFFQLLNQLEVFCERHFRIDSKGNNNGEVLARKLCSKYKEFSSMEKELQIQAAIDHVENLLGEANTVILCNRAMRVVRFLNNSKVDISIRKSYASILRDTIYPDECIIISNYFFSSDTRSAEMLKKWGVVDLNRGFFSCKEVEYFYKGVPQQDKL